MLDDHANVNLCAKAADVLVTFALVNTEITQH